VRADFASGFPLTPNVKRHSIAHISEEGHSNTTTLNDASSPPQSPGHFPSYDEDTFNPGPAHPNPLRIRPSPQSKDKLADGILPEVSKNVQQSHAKATAQGPTPPPVPEKPAGYTPSRRSRIPSASIAPIAPTAPVPRSSVRKATIRSRVPTASSIRNMKLFRKKEEPVEEEFSLDDEASAVVAEAIKVAKTLGHPTGLNARVEAHVMLEQAMMITTMASRVAKLKVEAATCERKLYEVLATLVNTERAGMTEIRSLQYRLAEKHCKYPSLAT
jgi:hypothetical protein